jgi:hypothetical protein
MDPYHFRYEWQLDTQRYCNSEYQLDGNSARLPEMLAVNSRKSSYTVKT